MQELEIIDVVEAKKKGGSIFVLIPVELCKKQNIIDGTRFALYLDASGNIILKRTKES